jgi:hypothetical protein
MTLPYPYEVETGALQTRAPMPRMPFDIRGHMLDALRVVDDSPVMFGVRLAAPAGAEAAGVVQHYQEALTQQFQERRPNADEATWEIFDSQARSQLERADQADEETLHALMMSIAGL